MRYVRLALLAACAATLLSGSALAQGEKSLSAPQGLNPFLLRANEAPAREFSRTPSFSWSPVRGAVRYEFQLAKNVSFNESSIFWVTGSVRGPATAIPLSLPWMTGKPFAAYARVRAVNGSSQVSPWSTPYGFNLRWKDVPTQLPEYPGLSRWSPVEGAIGYHETKPAQDQCQAGNMIEFGKDSSPVVAGQGTAYASGMSPAGRLVAAAGQKNVFYGRPLVAWQPVQGAAGYEIQWSHNRDRWRTLGSLETDGTAVTLPLKPGEWWYRVRARNPYLPGYVKRMAWSTPLSITVAKPKFRLVASSK